MKETGQIKSRHSVRKYRKEPIPREVVEDILDCGRLAPTARNVQPWLIWAVTDKSLLARLAGLTDHGKFIADAAACFAVFCLKSEKYYLEDGCAATMNLLHACHAHGLGACWIAGDKKPYAEDTRKLIGAPPGYSLVALAAAGYPAESPGEKGKKPLGDVTFIK